MASKTVPAALLSQIELFNVSPAVRRLGREAHHSIVGADGEQTSCHAAGKAKPAIVVEPSAHVLAAQTEQECGEACKQLQALLLNEPLIVKYGGLNELGIDRGMLRRFLTARQNNPEKARHLLLTSLEFRFNRLPATVDWNEMEHEARTGKMRVSGHDRHGRPVVVVDFSAQNTQDCKGHLHFLAFTLDHAISRMSGCVEKYVIFLNLSRFTYSCSPPRAFAKEMCDMLGACYPERCGNLIFYQAPRLFSSLFSVVKPFVDRRTAAKFVFISGEDGPGTCNDATLHEVFGARWRSLTGVGMPCETCKSSPGYNHARDWGETLSYEYSKYIQEDSTSTTASSSFDSSEDETPSDASFVEKIGCLVAVDSDAVSTSCESTPCLVPTSIAASVAIDSGSIEVDHVDEPLELPPSSLIDEEHLVSPSTAGHLVVSSVAQVAVEALATAKEAANAAREAAKAAQIAAQAAASAAVVAANLAQTAEKLATLAKLDAPLANTHVEPQSMVQSPAQLAQISPIEGIDGANFFMNAVSKFLGFWVMSVMPVTSMLSAIMRRLYSGRSLSC